MATASLLPSISLFFDQTGCPPSVGKLFRPAATLNSEPLNPEPSNPGPRKSVPLHFVGWVEPTPCFVGFRCTQSNLHVIGIIAKCETQQRPISKPSPKSFFSDLTGRFLASGGAHMKLHWKTLLDSKKIPNSSCRSRIKSRMTDPASRISWNYWIPATGSSPAQAPPE